MYVAVSGGVARSGMDGHKLAELRRELDDVL